MINAYLTDTVKLKSISFDKWNKPTTVETTVRAKVYQETKLVPGPEGVDVMSTARILMKGTEDISHDDKIEVKTKTYAILSIKEKSDFTSRYYEVLI